MVEEVLRYVGPHQNNVKSNKVWGCGRGFKIHVLRSRRLARQSNVQTYSEPMMSVSGRARQDHTVNEAPNIEETPLTP